MATLLGAIALAGCGPGQQVTGTYRPPPPLALVAIVDPSPAVAAAELRQLEAVIQAGVAPSQTLVVSLLSAVPAPATYVVRGGDSLSSIAGAQSVSLAALQDANPQLGPVANRDWNRIHPGDRVTVPAHAGTPARNAIVTRAPAGPPPPALVRTPVRPTNATTFQEAQYRRALTTAEQVNRDRIDGWQADAARALQPWQAAVVEQLRALSAALGNAGQVADEGDGLGGAIRAAANTLHGLPGRRVLLLLAGERVGVQRDAAPLESLARIHLVVANLPDASGTGFASAATAAGATVTTLNPALTELQLAATVNG